MNFGAVSARGWRAYADARRVVRRTGSAKSALAAIGLEDRSDVGRWNRLTGERHDEYRKAHEPVDADVAIVCVSIRPHLATAVAAHVRAQTWARTQLIFVANGPQFEDTDLDLVFRELACVTIERVPQSVSLGSGLNRGLDLTDARFVAKFDDDDLYGPHYLEDALRAHSYAGAGVVGKHSYCAQIESTGETYLRFPANEYRYSSTLAGGTLVIDRDEVDDQRFDDVSLGEDRAFLARCHRRGIATFSADRFNFVQVRGDSNTWTVPVDAFLSNAVPIDGDQVFR